MELPGTKEVAERSPHWASIVLVVIVTCGMNVLGINTFTTYLSEREQRELENDRKGTLVSEQRIATCHSVQVQGIEALDRVSERLESQGNAFSALIETLDDNHKQVHEDLMQLNSTMRDHKH